MENEEKWVKFYSDHLSDLVLLGFEFTNKVASEKKFNVINSLPGIIYLRTFFEIIDSIALNIRNGITEVPTRSLIRVLTEYFFGCMYLCKELNSYEDKSLSIAYTSILENEKGYSPFYEENLSHTYKMLKDDFNYMGTFDKFNFDYNSSKKFFKGVLEHPDFYKISEEYKRTKGQRAFKKKKFIPWYSLFYGPLNIAELSKNTGQFDMYETIYKEYSHDAHGSKVFRNQWSINQSSFVLSIDSIRVPVNMREPTILTTILTERLLTFCTRGLELENSEIIISFRNSLVKFLKKDPGFEPIDVKGNRVLNFDD